MVIVKLVVAVLIIVAVVLLLLRVHREISGGASLERPGGGKGKRGADKDNGNAVNELEAFIAAYRRGKDEGAAPAPPPTANTSATVRKSYLTPHTKLCYLVVKAALPDHHVFCNARLVDALELHASHPLANARIDLIVCNKELGPIAAVDVSHPDERASPTEREKTEQLQSAGIRYLRFTPNGIPKPTEIRDLIYRM
jgi:hypothetical protein